VDPGAITRNPDHSDARWGPLRQAPDSGRVVHSRFAEQFFVPASVAELVGASGQGTPVGISASTAQVLGCPGRTHPAPIRNPNGSTSGNEASV